MVRLAFFSPLILHALCLRRSDWLTQNFCICRHIMTGLGAYLYIIWGIWLRHCLNNKQDEYHLRWAHFWHIPEVIHTMPAIDEGVARAKKST